MSNSDIVMDPRGLGLGATPELLAKRISETLIKHYPGFLWGVNVNPDGGIVTVQNLSLTGRWGFILKLKELDTDPGLKKVMRAGGEILERFRLRRARAEQEAILALPRDNFGNKVFET
jgi:hypothetical protein